MTKTVWVVQFEVWNDNSIDGVDDHYVTFTDRIYTKSEDAFKYVFEVLCGPDGFEMDHDDVDAQLKALGSVKYFTDEDNGTSRWIAVRSMLLFD